MNKNENLKKEIIELCERKTFSKLCQRVYSFVMENCKDEFIFSKKSDFKYGFRKNNRGYKYCERIGVVQHGRNGNYWLFVNYN